MLQNIVEFLRTLYTPDKLIELLGLLLSSWAGYAALFGLVFAETGLLLGIVVPGDSMLFTVGMVVGAGHSNIVLVNAILIVAAILGDSTGYLLGRQTGPRIFTPQRFALFQAVVRYPHPGVSTSDTAARRFSSRGSCRSFGALPRSWRESGGCRIASFCHSAFAAALDGSS